MKVLSFLLRRYGWMTFSKNAGSFRARKKLSSWQANSLYFARFSSSFSFGHWSTHANFASFASPLSVVKSDEHAAERVVGLQLAREDVRERERAARRSTVTSFFSVKGFAGSRLRASRRSANFVAASGSANVRHTALLRSSA